MTSKRLFHACVHELGMRRISVNGPSRTQEKYSLTQGSRSLKINTFRVNRFAINFLRNDNINYDGVFFLPVSEMTNASIPTYSTTLLTLDIYFDASLQIGSFFLRSLRKSLWVCFLPPEKPKKSKTTLKKS